MSTNPQVYGCGAEPSTEERYLKAPILTLLASLEDDERSIISLHDVMDAYYTFCGRVKRISDVLSRSPSNVAALRFVEQHSVSIVKCLRRDVRRALVEPLLPASQDVFADYHVRFDKPRRRDEDMKIATDTVSICLTALRTVSYVLRVPALSQVFAADDLVQLANDVLDIIEFPLLPIPSDKKVRTLAVWVLSNGHFPVASVASRRTQLMRILNETILYSEDTFVIPNYLRALGSLLHAHSSIFLESCTLIFPPVIKRLSSDVDHIRTEAVYALSGFAFAVVSHDQDTRRMSVGPLRRPLQNSIDAADGKQASPSSKTRNLVTTVMALLGSGDKPAPTQHVVRAQVILASAIAISGAEIFTHKASLKLVLKVSAETARHNRRSVRIVHALVWRCLVWAFAELQRESDAGNTQKPLRKIRNSVLEVIKQERRDGIGAALISTLLGSPLTHGDPLAKQKNVGEAIAVLRSMAEDSANVRAEARAILSRLTSAIGSAPTPPSTPATEGRSLGEGIIVKELLDGTIQRMSEEQLAKALPELTQFSVEGIRPLMEAEIVASWDKLVESWMALVKKDVLGSQGVFSAPHDLLGPWQALLLVLAQLTQEHRHLTASAECAHKVANICCDILAWQGNPTTKPIDETALRVNQLRFVLMLWKVARNVFNASWLASAAEPILRAVLQRTYDLTKKEIADAWAELSGALVLSGSHDLLHRLAVHDEARQEMELKRHLWSVLAKSWCFSEAKPDWKVTVSLVTLPIGVFALCEDDVGLWEELLRATIASAGSVDTPSDRVLETIAARFDEQSESTSRHSRLVIPLLTHLKMDHDDMIPRDFLHLIDVFLCELYASKQEELYPALQTIRILSTLVQSCPQPAIVSLVSAVSDGLCIWIHDEEEFVPGQQYNDVIMPLYQATLNRLAGYSFTAESLGAIAPFLASTFKRIVHPAHGPTAFADFWNSVRHTLTLQSTAIHEDLKQALKINHDYFGGDLPSDVSYDSQSQTQSQSQEESIVPETPSSQLFYEPSHLAIPMAEGPTHSGPAYEHRRTVLNNASGSGSAYPASGSAGRRAVALEDSMVHPDGSTSTFSLQPGHARTEDMLYSDWASIHTPPRGRDTSMSQEVPLADMDDAQADASASEDTPTIRGKRTPREVPRASSVLLSPEVPFLQKDISPGPSPSYPLSRRANSLPSSSLPDPSPSFLPSLPIGRKRGYHAGPQDPSVQSDSQPRKKRRMPLRESGEGSSIGGAQRLVRGSPSRSSGPTAGPSKSHHMHSEEPQTAPRRTKWIFDGVVIPKRNDLRDWATASDAAVVSPLSSPPPSVAGKGETLRQRKVASPAEIDDYDTWEGTIDPDEARRIQQELDPSSEGEVKLDDRLTSSQIVDESLMLEPVEHLRRRNTAARHSDSQDYLPSSAFDENIVPSSQDDETGNSQRARPERPKTTPPLHASSSVPGVSERRSPLRRSHTTSDRLHLLRRACDGIKEDGSQLPYDAINEAEDMLEDMYSMLKRLKRRRDGEGRPVSG